MSGERERAIRAVLAYHRLSSLEAAPAKLQRASEPIPFRRYPGAPIVRFETGEHSRSMERRLGGAPRPFDLESLGRWLDDALGLAGWKRAGEAAFGLRRTPSAGNLHPTEAYLLATGGVEGLAPGLYHYSCFDHALELRREFPPGEPGLYVGIATIYWRTAWKYGERAFRLCHLDAGHAAAALAASAALAGWALAPVEIGDGALDSLLGLAGADGPEAERGILLLAVDRPGETRPGLPESATPLLGRPSQISKSHHPWPGIAEVHRSTRLERNGAGRASFSPAAAEMAEPSLPNLADWPREVLRRRRSTPHFDAGRTIGMDELRGLLASISEKGGGTHPLPPHPDARGRTLGSEGFARGLPVHLGVREGCPSAEGRARSTPRPEPRFDAAGPWLFPFRQQIGTLLFIHRVDGLQPGLYLLEDPGAEGLRMALRPDFAARPRVAAAAGLPLSQLAPGDARAAAASLAGGQEAAGSSSFTLALVGRAAGLMAEEGARAYRALHWQAGEIGHRLCLAATAAGLGATGLSGFHDDRLATFLGLAGDSWLPLYLLAVGPQAGADPALEPADRHRVTAAAPRQPSRGGFG